MWEDPSFAPSAASVGEGIAQPSCWRRFHALFPGAGVPPSAAALAAGGVQQGALGDCWLLAPLAALAASEPARARQLFADADRLVSEGRVTLRLWRHDRWEAVEIDTLLPCDASGVPVFCGRAAAQADGRGAWAALVEKAFAKRSGSYAALEGGTSVEALVDLTGGVAERVALTGGPSQSPTPRPAPVASNGAPRVAAGSERLPLDRTDGAYAELAARIARWRAQGGVLCATLSPRRQHGGGGGGGGAGGLPGADGIAEMHTVALLGLSHGAVGTDVLLIDTASAANPSAVTQSGQNKTGPASRQGDAAPRGVTAAAGSPAAVKTQIPAAAKQLASVAVQLPAAAVQLPSSALRLPLDEFCFRSRWLTVCWVMSNSPRPSTPTGMAQGADAAAGGMAGEAGGAPERRLWLQHIIPVPAMPGGGVSQPGWCRNPQMLLRAPMRGRVMVALAQRKVGGHPPTRADGERDADSAGGGGTAGTAGAAGVRLPADDEFIGLHVLAPPAPAVSGVAQGANGISPSTDRAPPAARAEQRAEQTGARRGGEEALLTCEASDMVAEAGPTKRREIAARFVARPGTSYVIVPHQLLLGAPDTGGEDGVPGAADVAGGGGAAGGAGGPAIGPQFVLRVWADVPCRLTPVAPVCFFSCSGAWDEGTAGGRPPLCGWGANPQWAVVAPGGARVRVRLVRAAPRLRVGSEAREDQGQAGGTRDGGHSTSELEAPVSIPEGEGASDPSTVGLLLMRAQLAAPAGGHGAGAGGRSGWALAGQARSGAAGCCSGNSSTAGRVGGGDEGTPVLGGCHACISAAAAATPQLVEGLPGGAAVRVHQSLTRATAAASQVKLTDESFIRHHFANSGRRACNGKLVASARPFDEAHRRQVEAARALADASAEREARQAALDVRAAKAAPPPLPRAAAGYVARAEPGRGEGGPILDGGEGANFPRGSAPAAEEHRAASALGLVTRAVVSSAGSTVAEALYARVAEMQATLPPGEPMLLVPSTWFAGQTGPFRIQILSTAPLMLRSMPATVCAVAIGAWGSVSPPGATRRGGRALGAGGCRIEDTWHTNPQFGLWLAPPAVDDRQGPGGHVPSGHVPGPAGPLTVKISLRLLSKARGPRQATEPAAPAAVRPCPAAWPAAAGTATSRFASGGTGVKSGRDADKAAVDGMIGFYVLRSSAPPRRPERRNASARGAHASAGEAIPTTIGAGAFLRRSDLLAPEGAVAADGSSWYVLHETPFTLEPAVTCTLRLPLPALPTDWLTIVPATFGPGVCARFELRACADVPLELCELREPCGSWG